MESRDVNNRDARCCYMLLLYEKTHANELISMIFYSYSTFLLNGSSISPMPHRNKHLLNIHVLYIIYLTYSIHIKLMHFSYSCGFQFLLSKEALRPCLHPPWIIKTDLWIQFFKIFSKKNYVCRCFLHWQITWWLRSRVSSSEVVS
jgi:hypothetical protein